MALEIGQAAQFQRIGNGVKGHLVLLGPGRIFYSPLWEHDGVTG